MPSRGLLAIICIGETESQRLGGKALSVCGDQIAGSVPEGMTLSANAIAYEPFWAIATSACRPFPPVRAPASISPAIALRSSSSRYAINPASEVTTDPRN